jgi:hypothetical protein
MNTKTEHFKEFERERIKRKIEKYDIEDKLLSERLQQIQKDEAELNKLIEEYLKLNTKTFLQYFWNDDKHNRNYKLFHEIIKKSEDNASNVILWNADSKRFINKLDKLKAAQEAFSEKK